MATVYLAALLAAVIASAPRRVGDGGEYFVMASRMAALQPPFLTRAELDATKKELTELGTGFEASLIDYPNLVGSDGRQDFLHFWLYPAIASPMVAVARALDFHPNWGFTVTNLLLLAGAVFVLALHVPFVATVAAFVSPIVWWTDKAHTEAFLFATLSVAAVMLHKSPSVAMVMYALAGAQNAALGMTFPIFALVALTVANGSVRAWLGAAAGMSIVALPFVYSWTRLGRLSPMAEYAQVALPSPGQLAAFVLEPNIGIAVHAPVYVMALAGAMWIAVRGRTHKVELWWWPAVIQVLLLVAWSQNPNLNHGGTPGINRWVLSLLALSIPWLGAAYQSLGGLNQRVAATLILVAAGWSAAQHLPSRPEGYLRPTQVAEMVWGAGWMHATPAEVFAERSQQREPPHVPAANARCDVVLMASAQWPLRCVPPGVEVPRDCQAPGSMCYAVASGDTWSIVRSANNGFFFFPSVPSWPAVGPLANGVRAVLLELEPGSREWAIEDTRRWVEESQDVQIGAVLRREAALFLYLSRTGGDPRLRVHAPGYSGASIHTLIPVSTLSRVAESDARFDFRLPPGATNLAVTLVPAATSRVTP